MAPARLITLQPEQVMIIHAAGIWRGAPRSPEKEALVCLNNGTVAALESEKPATGVWSRVKQLFHGRGGDNGPGSLPGPAQVQEYGVCREHYPAENAECPLWPPVTGWTVPPIHQRESINERTDCRYTRPVDRQGQYAPDRPPAVNCPRPCFPGRKVLLLDLPGCTILPGLIDCHVHLALDGRDFALAQQQWSEKPALYRRVAADLSGTLEHGIVAVRDGGDRAGVGLTARKWVMEGTVAGPLVRAAGYALHRQGKYGSFLGPGLTPAELERAVDSLARLGVDLVKVLVSGIVSFTEYGRVGGLQFSLEELRRIVYRARCHGLKVMAHASGDEAVRLAVEAGVDSIEHGYFLSEESLYRMAERGIPWVPTVIPVAARVRGNPNLKKDPAGRCGAPVSGPEEDIPGGGNETREKTARQTRPPAGGRPSPYTPAEIAVVTRTYRRQLQMIKLAREMGVTLGVGTDAGAAGVPHGGSYLQELLLYREAGLSPADILTAATGNGAAILGMDHRLGKIEPGRPAYLVVVQGNPWEDISALGRMKYVIGAA